MAKVCPHTLTHAHTFNEWCHIGKPAGKCAAHGALGGPHEYNFVVMGREVARSCPGGPAAVRCPHGKYEGHTYRAHCSGP
jgi:hypothetical protein